MSVSLPIVTVSTEWKEDDDEQQEPSVYYVAGIV
jgi:hypothetical protein